MINLANIFSVSGFAADIQLALNQALLGDNVVIPNSLSQPDGKWHWNGQTISIPGGVNLLATGLAGCDGHPNFIAYTPTTIIHNDKAPPWTNYPMFTVNGLNGKKTRISGIQLEATPPATLADETTGTVSAIELDRAINFRVDHCTFIDFSGTAVFADANGGGGSGTCLGLIDHCINNNPYKDSNAGYLWAYGYYVRGNCLATAPWEPVSSFFGKYNTIPGYATMYVEDCYFARNRHSLDAIEGGFYCSRYNMFELSACGYQAGYVDMHGAAGWQSGRGFEAYNNLAKGRPGNIKVDGSRCDAYDFQLRDGSALIYNNTFVCDPGNSSGNIFALLANDNALARKDIEVNNTFIWNNTYSNCQFVNNSGYYVENKDYFLRAPIPADGFTYTPYPYPHPLISGLSIHSLAIASPPLSNVPFTLQKI